MTYRRGIILTSFGAGLCMMIIGLYQTGITRRLRDPPVRRFKSSQVAAVPPAYRPLGLPIPDSLLGLVSYAGTAALAGLGGPDRHRRAPGLVLLMAAKVYGDDDRLESWVHVLGPVGRDQADDLGPLLPQLLPLLLLLGLESGELRVRVLGVVVEKDDDLGEELHQVGVLARLGVVVGEHIRQFAHPVEAPRLLIRHGFLQGRRALDREHVTQATGTVERFPHHGPPVPVRLPAHVRRHEGEELLAGALQLVGELVHEGIGVGMRELVHDGRNEAPREGRLSLGVDRPHADDGIQVFRAVRLPPTSAVAAAPVEHPEDHVEIRPFPGTEELIEPIQMGVCIDYVLHPLNPDPVQRFVLVEEALEFGLRDKLAGQVQELACALRRPPSIQGVRLRRERNLLLERHGVRQVHGHPHHRVEADAPRLPECAGQLHGWVAAETAEMAFHILDIGRHLALVVFRIAGQTKDNGHQLDPRVHRDGEARGCLFFSTFHRGGRQIVR